MRLTWIPLLFVALAFAPAAVRAAECRASDTTVKVRLTLKRASGDDNIAGVVMSVFYPVDKLVIEGQGKDAAKAALSELPDGANALYEDRDGELRLLFGKAMPLTVNPVCEVTFHRCEGVKDVAPEDVTCRVTDASDEGANNPPNGTCLVSAAS
jgi:hypothetical protein